MVEKNKKVLIVDDEESIRLLFTNFYKMYGFEVAAAADGVEALDKIREGGDVGLLLTDMIMPKMNGADLVEAYRKNGGTGKVYCVSAECEGSLVARVCAAGIHGFLEKPFSLAQLPINF